MAIQLVSASSQSLTINSSLSTFQNVAGGTVMAWVKLSSTPSTEMHIVMYSVGTNNYNARLSLSSIGSPLKFRASARRLDANSVSSINGATTINSTNIYHVCAVANYTGTSLKVYVNGVLDGSLTIAGWTANSSNTASQAARIGSNSNGTSTRFNGIVTDLRSYNRVLTDQEIGNIYNARGSDSIVYGLVDQWKCINEAPTTIITTMPSIGSLQGPATAVNSPTFYESNLDVVTNQNAI